MALVTSIQTGGVNNHPTTSEEANALATDFVSEGIVGTISNTLGVAPATGAFAANAQGTPDMTVAITAGVAYVTATPTSQASQTFRVKLSANENVTISSNSSGSTKYDWIYVKLDATNLNAPNVAGDNAASLVTSRSTSQSTDDGTPPTYGYPIAVVTVSNGATSITNGNIRDTRANCVINQESSAVANGWTNLGYQPNTVTHNGNRSYDLVFNSTDLTSTLGNGNKLKLTRLVTPPTQCTSLNGTNQYYSKTSPAGMAFTDDFAVSAWVKLTSYATGAILGRYDGTNGFEFYINSSGQVTLIAHKGASGNYSQVVSYQAVPLNRWVHVAAQLDMSSFTTTTTTSYVMIDGVDVPVSVSRAGTNPTDFTQAGTLQIGASNSTIFFPGKLAQVAIYSAKVTQATIRASYAQTLTGSETSLVSAYSFNNSINDLSANANNLSANGSAVATNSDSPMKSAEYAIVTGTTFSTNTTLNVQVPEGYAIPTSGGVSAVSYSQHASPYGFPSDKGRWEVYALYRAQSTQSSASSGTWYNVGGYNITAPIGRWNLSYQSSPVIGATGIAIHYQTLSTGTSTESDIEFTTEGYHNASVINGAPRYVERPINLTVQTPYYLNQKQSGGSSVTLYTMDTAVTIIKLKCDYI